MTSTGFEPLTSSVLPRDAYPQSAKTWRVHVELPSIVSCIRKITGKHEGCMSTCRQLASGRCRNSYPLFWALWLHVGFNTHWLFLFGFMTGEIRDGGWMSIWRQATSGTCRVSYPLREHDGFDTRWRLDVGINTYTYFFLIFFYIS